MFVGNQIAYKSIIKNGFIYNKQRKLRSSCLLM